MTILEKKTVFIREPTLEDEKMFLSAMQRSQSFHSPWVKSPQTPQEFSDYFERYQQANQKSFLVINKSDAITGVFNISEIVRGAFQNAYLGFYAVVDYVGQGYMSAGLKLVLQKIFKELNLHRIEANIQSENTDSIYLVKNNGFRNEGYSPRYLKINNEWRGHEHWAMTVEDYVRNDPEVLKNDHVDIVPYNSEWPGMASTEINKLRAILPSKKVIDIQHVGSTAIPGASAKPIIDIQIAVNSLEEIKAIAISALQKLGYEYWDENPDSERMFFVKGMPPFGEKRTHHVHIFEPSSKHWRGKIIFRDYLISNPDVLRDYEKLKIALAQQHTYDREQYTDAKAKFVKEVLKKANDFGPYKITINHDVRDADEKIIHEGMLVFTEGVLGDKEKWFEKSFSILLKDEADKVHGGILAKFDSESMYIDSLWVDESLRFQGFGTKLLKVAESEAYKLGCRYLTVDTYSFQAEGFYLKNGYERLGEIKNYYLHHTKIFLRKNIESLISQ